MRDFTTAQLHYHMALLLLRLYLACDKGRDDLVQQYSQAIDRCQKMMWQKD